MKNAYVLKVSGIIMLKRIANLVRKLVKLVFEIILNLLINHKNMKTNVNNASIKDYKLLIKV